MSRHIERQLTPGEHIEIHGQQHWVVYLNGMVCALGALVMGFWLSWLLAGFMLATGIISLLKGFVQQKTVESAVTNRRVLAKVGLIRRQIFAIGFDKIESVELHQSVMGRLLGYGTVVVRGHGGGTTPLVGLDNPEAFKAQLALLLDSRRGLASADGQQGDHAAGARLNVNERAVAHDQAQ